ncbi:MAG: hypothetical protein QM669_05820 [Siphonobacter sp.]
MYGRLNELLKALADQTLIEKLNAFLDEQYGPTDLRPNEYPAGIEDTPLNLSLPLCRFFLIKN